MLWRTRKPAERRPSDSAGFAVHSTRRTSEPDLVASGFTVSELAIHYARLVRRDEFSEAWSGIKHEYNTRFLALRRLAHSSAGRPGARIGGVVKLSGRYAGALSGNWP